MAAKVIAISNHKGGVGKTTSAVNIGAGLSNGNTGKQVLLIDLDPQSNLTQSLGIEPEATIYGSLRGEYPLTPMEVTNKLHLIASTLDLSGAEVELSGEAGREFVLRDLIEPLKKSYDYILIDCPPSLGLLTLNAFTAADEVYIPLQTQYLALQGLTKLVEIVDKVKKRLNKKLYIGGVILTQFDSRKVLDKDVVASVLDHFKDKVFNTKIRNNVSLAEAPSVGQDIFRYNAKSTGAEDYLALCKEIMARNL
jgi:chromosome partitioning protein